jgi:hypothetical protein
MWHVWERVKVRIGFGWGNRSESKHLEELGKIILKWIFKQLDWSVDEIDLANNRDRLRILVKVVIKPF